MTQVCKKCKVEKDEKEYYVHHSNKSGFSHVCKICDNLISSARKKRNRDKINKQVRDRYATCSELRERISRQSKSRYTREIESGEVGYVKKYFPTEQARSKERARYHEKKPHRVASSMVREAVKSGRIVKPSNCTKCDKQDLLHGHHEDYNKPLEVIWLCHSCHMSAHGKNSYV